MFRKKIIALLLPLAILSLIACTEESNPELDKQNFTRIFDNNQFDSAFYPIDLKQTSDGGYLILAVLLHNMSGYFLGYWSARLLRMNEKDCRTIAIEVGDLRGIPSELAQATDRQNLAAGLERAIAIA